MATTFPKAKRGRPAGVVMDRTARIIGFLKKNHTAVGCQRAAKRFKVSIDRIYQVRREHAKAIGYTLRPHRTSTRRAPFVATGTPDIPDGFTVMPNGRLRKTAQVVIQNVIDALPKNERPIVQESLTLLLVPVPIG